MARYPVAGARPDGRIPISMLADEQAIFWSHRLAFFAFPNSAAYPPTLYAPQILGWRLTEALHLSIVHSLLCVRLLTALCCIAIGWFALRVGRVNPWLMTAYLLLPTVMGLVASCSQDALLTSFAALAAAILSRAVAERRTLLPWEWALATVLFGAIAMARPPYLPLALTLFLPALCAAGPRGWRSYFEPTLAFAFIAAALFAWQAAAPATASYEGHIAGVDPKLQIAFLRLHPFRGAFNVVAGTVSMAPHLTVKALYSLGWNDIYPSNALYGILMLSLAGFCVVATWHGLPTWRARVLLLASVLASIVAISLAEYLVWTPVGGHKLEGPLPRYYPPFVPFLLLLSSGRLRVWKSSGRTGWIVAASSALFSFVLLTPPWLLSHRYYGLGPIAVLRATLR
jgi:uncharacterized membrane protein